jgi:hypothetical protein
MPIIGCLSKDPVRGQTVTESLNAMSQAYLDEATYPLRDPAGGEVRSLYRIRPNRVQVFGSTPDGAEASQQTPGEGDG